MRDGITWNTMKRCSLFTASFFKLLLLPWESEVNVGYGGKQKKNTEIEPELVCDESAGPVLEYLPCFEFNVTRGNKKAKDSISNPVGFDPTLS